MAVIAWIRMLMQVLHKIYLREIAIDDLKIRSENPTEDSISRIKVKWEKRGGLLGEVSMEKKLRAYSINQKLIIIEIDEFLTQTFNSVKVKFYHI